MKNLLFGWLLNLLLICCTVKATQAGFREEKEAWYKNKTNQIGDLETNNYQHFKELEWLIGSWVAENPQGKLYSTYKWSKNKNHIIFNFKAIDKNGTQLFEGVEIIYWNMPKQGIYSWSLNSSGGESPEEHWTRDGADGNSWKLASSKENPFVIYTPKNADSFIWEQKIYSDGGVISSVFGPFENKRMVSLMSKL